MTVDEQRAACLAVFKEAARDGQRGNFVRAQNLVHAVRLKHGDAAAETAKIELWKFIRSGKTL